MLKRLAIISLCLLSAILGAVDAETKTQARTLYAEAAKNLDIWTMLQLEVWGENNGARLRSPIPGIEVAGDPLFATPARLEHVHNAPDGVVLTSRERVYQWATDGRPVSQSWQLPASPWEDTVEPAGTAFGLTSCRGKEHDENIRIFMVAAVRLADGSVACRAEIEGPSGDSPGQVAVASDCSAVAGEIRGSSNRLMVAIGNELHVLAGWHQPQAIGRNGAWLIANNPKGRRALMTKDEKSQHVIDSAIGPGTAAVLIKDQVSLVKDDGSLSPIDVPIGLGKNPVLTTVGNWLVVYSGEGATSKPAIDVLGNLSGGGKPQPPSCALYRWRELIANPQAVAVDTQVTPLVLAPSQVAAIFRWHGTTLELIDLSGDELQIRPFATAPADIAGVEDDFQVTTVTLADQKRWLLDPSGNELLPPMSGWLMVMSRTWAVSRGGDVGKQVYHTHGLAPDVAKRSTAALQIDPGEWDVIIPIHIDQAFVWRTDGIWRRVDPLSGKITAQGDAADRPGVDRTRDPRGRFYARGARLFAKSDPPPPHQWCGIDAWRNGRTLFVLDRDGRVLMSGRKRGEWQELGDVPGAWQFSRSGDTLAVASGDRTTLATITNAGRLDVARNAAFSELPPGLWQVRNLEYVPPRAGNQRWNPATGLAPEHVRCPDGDGLLVPLGPVVLFLDASAGKALGKPR